MTPSPKACQELIAEVGSFIDSQRLIAPRQGVLLAVSGGRDSVAMLRILRELSLEPARSYRLSVAHLNHQLRPTAAAEAEFVAALAQELTLPVFIESIDVAAIARSCKIGIEQAARQQRYAFFERAAKASSASLVAVAHHADDNVETIVQRLLRGTNVLGLQGIPSTRELREGVKIVRPLINLPRQTIDDFCRQMNLRWCEDESNASLDFGRNFIRHKLLPLAAELNPSGASSLLKLSASARELGQMLQDLAEQALTEARAEFGTLSLQLDCPSLLARRRPIRLTALHMGLGRLGVRMGPITSRHLHQLDEMLQVDGATALELPGGWVVRRVDSQLTIARCEDQPVLADLPADDSSVVALPCPGRLELPGGRTISVTVEDYQPATFTSHCRNRRPGVELLDADKIVGQLTVGPRQRGESFVPLGLHGTQSVSNFLTNAKLSRAQRSGVLCIRDGLGLVYLAPLRLADRVKVTCDTRRLLRIEYNGW